MEACRAGAWPTPAVTTQPMSTSSTSSGATPARSSAPRMAVAPSWGAGTDASALPKEPMGVRAAERRTEVGIAESEDRRIGGPEDRRTGGPGQRYGPDERAEKLAEADARDVQAA